MCPVHFEVVWSDLQETRRHSVLPVNRTMLGCLGLWHSNVFRQVQVQFLPASVRALNRACYVKKAKQIALNRSFKCDHRALFLTFLHRIFKMGLCKCPKRRVTNQFCFEHRVNVCEHCMVQKHPKVIKYSIF